MRGRASGKAASFTESVIREMTREALAHGAINLAQGFPDFPAPDFIKDAAISAIKGDFNQYAITWGSKTLRDTISNKMRAYYGMEVDPEREITVTCGATEGMIASLLAVLDPGDEVIIFEPFYENYGPDAILCGARPRFISLRPPDFTFDEKELKRTINKKTRAMILNTPNNPTGKVFSREELEFIADLCIKHDIIVFTDEIYEHIIYDGHAHIPIATLPGMKERTVTVNGISKTFSVTGWRIGYAIASPEITSSIRKVHDFLTVGAAAPLQEAAAKAISSNADYYRQLGQFYLKRRDYLFGVLEGAGFKCYKPYGAYYIMADFGKWGFKDDVEFAKYLTREIGVAPVPGSSFYKGGNGEGKKIVRFAFCKKMETLEAAAERLKGPV
jgi:aspartate/methionine/tyrosine aminotransferase